MGSMEIQINMKSKILAILFVSAICSYAQEKKLYNVKGEASISNITPEQARIKAIEYAKVEALRLAGSQEWIQSFDYLEKREANNHAEEFFHSLTSVQTMGNVIQWEVVKEDKKIDALSNLVYEVWINATVLVYKTKIDPEFRFLLSDLKQVYKNDEDLNFSITPQQEGYLTIFMMDQAENISMLYPNEHEQLIKMNKDQKYEFPQSSFYRYQVYSDLKEEVNYLFLLYTRKNVKYTGSNFKEFIEHVYQIEPQERFLTMERFRIVR
jgi:hypothetical protein